MKVVISWCFLSGAQCLEFLCIKQLMNVPETCRNIYVTNHRLQMAARFHYTGYTLLVLSYAKFVLVWLAKIWEHSPRTLKLVPITC